MVNISVCITGGSGFLGAAIVRELQGENSAFSCSRIVVFDSAPPPSDIASAVDYVPGDVRNEEAVASALEGVDIVFHAAAIVDWGTKSPSEVRAVNVGGTEAVLSACKRSCVRVLVLTSSLDATFSGRELRGVDEDLPYPKRHPNMYCRSKMEAEILVNQAHGTVGSNGARLCTCSLRPADIYGPGDPYHMPPLLEMVQKGFYVRIGNGSAVSQQVYIGNIALAHIQAAGAFLNGREPHGGRSYFITDGEPANFFAFFDRIIETAGYTIRPQNFRIPFVPFYLLGALVELVTLPVRAVLKRAPRVSRFAAIYTCTTYTFTSKRAGEDFGYTPVYGEAEGVAKTAAFYRNKAIAGGAPRDVAR